MTSDVRAAMPVMERLVSGIWESELAVNEVGPQSHFFELGGDSLILLNVMFRVGESLGAEIPPATLMDNPILADFCRALELESLAAGGSSAVEGVGGLG